MLLLGAPRWALAYFTILFEIPTRYAELTLKCYFAAVSEFRLSMTLVLTDEKCLLYARYVVSAAAISACRRLEGRGHVRRQPTCEETIRKISNATAQRRGLRGETISSIMIGVPRGVEYDGIASVTRRPIVNRPGRRTPNTNDDHTNSPSWRTLREYGEYSDRTDN